MAFPHFGHPYGGASQFLVSANSSATCCDSSPRSVPDVASGSTPAAAALCLAPYESRLLGSARPELGTALGIYGAPYAAAAAAQSYPGYLPYSPEPPALYGALNAQYEFKESAGSFTPSLPQPGAYYPYEPTLGHYPYDRYHAAASELSGAGRRKNATRETTSTLKAWLHEHRKNPYPTKGEKIMLAIVTKMTLTQVSTWFANARRRLKKENKMTWAPKSRGGEERRAEEGAAEEPPGCCLRGHPKALAAAESREARGLLRLSDLEDLEEEEEEREEEEEEEEEDEEEAEVTAMDRLAEFHEDAQAPPPAPCTAAPTGRRPEPRFSFPAPPGSSAGEADFLRAEPGAPALATRLPCSPKPRIWSLAHTATALAVEGAPPAPPAPPEPRGPPECRLVPRRPPVLRDSAPDQPCRGARAFGKPALAMPALPLGCAPCPRRREAAGQCQFPSGAEAG